MIYIYIYKQCQTFLSKHVVLLVAVNSHILDLNQKKINLSEDKEKKDEVDEMLSELKEFNSVLSKWDLEFIKSIKTCIEKNNSISLKQFDKLASIVNSINKE